MWPNPHETVDLVTFTEEILNGKLHFLYSWSQAFLLFFTKFSFKMMPNNWMIIGFVNYSKVI